MTRYKHVITRLFFFIMQKYCKSMCYYMNIWVIKCRQEHNNKTEKLIFFLRLPSEIGMWQIISVDSVQMLDCPSFLEGPVRGLYNLNSGNRLLMATVTLQISNKFFHQRNFLIVAHATSILTNKRFTCCVIDGSKSLWR